VRVGTLHDASAARLARNTSALLERAGRCHACCEGSGPLEASPVLSSGDLGRSGTMIGILVLVVVLGGFVVWDRLWATSPSPDVRMVRAGFVVAAVGLVFSALAWWLIVPVVVLLVGCTLVVVGRHRVTAVA